MFYVRDKPQGKKDDSKSKRRGCAAPESSKPSDELNENYFNGVYGVATVEDGSHPHISASPGQMQAPLLYPPGFHGYAFVVYFM